MEQTIKQRVRNVIDISGLSVSAFERKLGWSNGYYSSCSDNLSLQKVQDVVNVFKVNRNWLLSGNGEMFDKEYVKEEPQPQEKSLAKLFEIEAPFGSDNNSNKDMIHISEYKKLREYSERTIGSLTENISKLTTELSDQGKRMDVILEILKNKL